MKVVDLAMDEEGLLLGFTKGQMRLYSRQDLHQQVGARGSKTMGKSRSRGIITSKNRGRKNSKIKQGWCKNRKKP